MKLQINRKAQNVRYFFFSQYLADGIRITLSIILPAIICASFGRLDIGIIISEGALCVSIGDSPGPVQHKRNGMLYSSIFVFLTALLTGLVNDNVVLLALLVLFSSFFFTMFTVYGNRAASVGTAALIIMILRMAKINTPEEVVLESLLILGGGAWYMAVALLLFKITPYRPAQRSLGNCVHETAGFLRIKAALYDTRTVLDDEYRRLVTQQVIVNEKQNAVRELLFKNREIVKEPTRAARLLVLTFTDVVELYEQIMATWYDYSSLRARFGSTGILDDVSVLIKNMADELDMIGEAILANTIYKKKYDFLPGLEALKIKIDAVDDTHNSKLILKKILVNLRNLGEKVNEILNYFNGESSKRTMRSSGDYSKFVSHQTISGKEFIQNFTLTSSVFRHSLRMMITCGAGLLIGKMLPYGHHSYWILLTIIIILKPGFSLTKQRNFERFTGTIAGGLIGIVVLTFIHDRAILFMLIIIFMTGTYTFKQLNYIVMVIFMTPYILIFFHFLGMGFVNVAEERLLDTGIASLLAFLASYLLFPHWESRRLDNYMASVLKSNINYLRTITGLPDGDKNSLEYSLARKDVFVSTANLSAAFHRMLSEPRSKQRNGREIYEFVVLNHVLSSNIAGLIAGVREGEGIFPKEVLPKIKRAIVSLEESLQYLDKKYVPAAANIKVPAFAKSHEAPGDHLFEQPEFICKLATEIRKITQKIADPPALLN
jgi:uncharacterized membrane protein (TIGR01666 family)